MSVAVLTTVLPRARRLGGDIASQAFIDAMREVDPQLRVYGYDRDSEDAPPVAWEVCAGRRVIETAAASRRQAVWWMLLALAMRRPYSVQKYVSRRYRRAVRGLAAEGVELVVVDHAQAGWLLRSVEPLPFVYVAHNVESEVYRTQAAAAAGRIGRWRYAREARLTEALERDLAARSVAVWALTPRDAAWLAERTPAPLTSFDLPPAVIPPARAPGAAAFDVALLGTWTWESNAVGLRWFADEVLGRLGGLDVRVAGLGAADVLGADAPVTVSGRVPDAAAFLQDARVVVLPTRAGGGVQVKAIDAIAAGVPVVATSLAVRGISDLPEHVVVADDPEAFAGAIADAVAAGPGARADGHAWGEHRAQRFRADVAAALAAALSRS